MVGERVSSRETTARQGFRGDRSGVSQVIGVVLIVAITVTLAGIIAGSLFAFSDQTENPTPTFTTETQFDEVMAGGDGQSLSLKHVSGDGIETAEIEIVVRDAKTDSGAEVEYVGNVFSSQISGQFTSGKEITIDQRHFEDGNGKTLDNSGAYLDLEDATVLVTWEDPATGSDLTATLYECDVEFPNCEQSP